ncbi:hypothetical protein CL634_04560 [bacterium]|nr:hypothetical protein [bacterium]|tara:strand:+ start:492 stop:845 length:354 start_codon:yes stop_codon:yes gene_type:complete
MPTKKKSKSKNILFIGRWQPFHEGHRKMIGEAIKEGHNVIIAIRDTKVSKSNPYSVAKRKNMIAKIYTGNRQVSIIKIPDIDAVWIGRKVGYRVIKTGSKASGTEIRAKLRRLGNLK